MSPNAPLVSHRPGRRQVRITQCYWREAGSSIEIGIGVEVLKSRHLEEVPVVHPHLAIGTDEERHTDAGAELAFGRRRRRAVVINDPLSQVLGYLLLHRRARRLGLEVVVPQTHIDYHLVVVHLVLNIKSPHPRIVLILGIVGDVAAEFRINSRQLPDEEILLKKVVLGKLQPGLELMIVIELVHIAELDDLLHLFMIHPPRVVARNNVVALILINAVELHQIRHLAQNRLQHKVVAQVQVVKRVR